MGIGRRNVHNSSPTQVLQRSRKLSKDEMILRLGDGKAVAAKVVGSFRLVVSNHIRIDLKDVYFVPSMVKNIISIPMLDSEGFKFLINKSFCLVFDDVHHLLGTLVNGLYILQQPNLIMIAQHKRKVDNHENAQIWHARLGHISKDRIRSMVMFYLMRYKSEAFGRFKEYRLEVENQTNRKIKALRSDRSGEYLSGEFIDYLKENGIPQWTSLGTPQLNRVAERRNRTLLDMVRSMMSFAELPPSFLGYAFETAAKLVNIAPSKLIPQMPYEIWHDKPASYKYLRVWGSPAYVKRLVVDKLDSRSSLCSLCDEVLIEESSGEHQHDSTTSFEPTVHTDGVPVLRMSTRESRVPKRYGFVGLTSQLDNDLTTYGEAMLDIDSNMWLEAMKSEMNSMDSNQVWTFVDPPKGARPVGCKWIYKPKLGADEE
ncbi:UNVERIFIED_CONTAM: hypothetical protein Sradi_3466500, partial [Sesamum radiatum]